MAKPKLKRQGILGQFLLGSDLMGAPIQTTVPLSSAYTRSHQTSGLVIGGRSARNFYHPIPASGVILNSPGITIYRWTNFALFSGNAWSSLANGLTVDGLIDPVTPITDNPMHFTLSGISWQSLGVPLGSSPTSVRVLAKTRMIAPLPQFVGHDTGGGLSQGNILDFFVAINGSPVSLQVNLGAVGFNVILGQYDTGYVGLDGLISYEFVLPPVTFDVDLEILWGHADARFNLQALQFNIFHTP